MNDTIQKLKEALSELVLFAWDFIKKFLSRIFHLASDTDVDGTISGIKSGVVLSGSNLWILICSTIIACIGLDTNSVAVIIGAMLISPLMSPILGIGLSLGINDREYLGKSTLNFVGAIFLSLLVAVVYFNVTPFGGFTTEMKSRIQPTLLDAFVALFGGLAGIIAGSRTQKTNAIPGVAIATALMPPLCTSGYGLANLDFKIFGGAFYLFFINAVLISLSTYAIVRFLKFPKMEEEEKSMISRPAMLVALFLLLLPSVFFLLHNLHEIFEKRAIEGIAESKFGEIENLRYTKSNDTIKINVSFYGEDLGIDSIETIEKEVINGLNGIYIYWFTSMLERSQVNTCLIRAYPTAPVGKDILEETSSSVRDLDKDLSKVRFDLDRLWQNYEIQRVDYQVLRDSFMTDTIPFYSIKKEVKALYPEIKTLSIGRPTTTYFVDTISDRGMYLAAIRWQEADPTPKSRRGYKSRDRSEDQRRLQSFLTVKLHADTVLMVNY